MANANLNLVKQIHGTLNGNHGAIARFHQYMAIWLRLLPNRYKKELNDLNKLVQKAEELVAKQSLKVKLSLSRKVTKEKIELNTALIEKRKLLLGIKGYCTDLSEQQFSNELVIEPDIINFGMLSNHSG